MVFRLLFFVVLVFAPVNSYSFDPIDNASPSEVCGSECRHGIWWSGQVCESLTVGRAVEVCNKTKGLSSKTQIDKIVKDCISKCQKEI